MKKNFKLFRNFKKKIIQINDNNKKKEAKLTLKENLKKSFN
jgi:hypothetical protein